MLGPIQNSINEPRMNSDRKIYYNKRILLSESFDTYFPIDRDSDSDTEVEYSDLFGSDLKSENLNIDKHIDHDISNISGNHYMLDDSMSQIIATSFLDEIGSEEVSLSEGEKMVNDEWSKQIELHKLNEVKIRGTFQEPIKEKLELDYTPTYTENDVYYLFQYHYIEHAIDWLFLPEEPYVLIELLSDQQAIYANQTLTMITDKKMPEGEIMP
jgi:hypothetical protein